MSLHHASLTRIANFEGAELRPIPRADWQWGDYIIGEVVTPPPPGRMIELRNGRQAIVDIGDRVVGALGVRMATLEATGTWEDIGEDGRFHALTSAGLFGALGSISPFIGRPLDLQYRGHMLMNGESMRMRDWALTPVDHTFETPVFLIVGSSMSAGKTSSGRKIIRRLKHMGMRVAAAKLTGAGRFRDVQSLGDAGADAIFDFTDAGLPSTVCPEAVFREAIGALLTHIAAVKADVVVIEAGASPLEPYNGEACLDMLSANVRLMLLCASDPYSVVGITTAFGREPDLVSGIACNTDAGLELVQKLTGVEALRLVQRRYTPRLDELLSEAFGDCRE